MRKAHIVTPRGAGGLDSVHELSHACSVRWSLGLSRPAWPTWGSLETELTEVWSLLNDLIPVLLDNMALSSTGR